MSVWGISMVRDEADIIGRTAFHMACQVDHVLAADNESTDATREILEGLGVEVLHDSEPGYFQSRKMSALAERARLEGAEWLVPFDADEFWMARDGRRIADVLSELPADVLLAEADLYDHAAVAGEGDDPITRMPWRRPEPAPLPKVAVRAREGLTIHQGNHGASFPSTDHPPTIKNLLVVHHYALRSPEQMIRKARNGAAAYAATDLPEEVGAHWRGWGALSDEQLEEVFATYYFSEDPEADGLVFDPVG